MGDLTTGTANHVKSGYCGKKCANRYTKCNECFRFKGEYTMFSDISNCKCSVNLKLVEIERCCHVTQPITLAVGGTSLELFKFKCDICHRYVFRDKDGKRVYLKDGAGEECPETVV